MGRFSVADIAISKRLKHGQFICTTEFTNLGILHFYICTDVSFLRLS